jgi:hypothetical protein
VLERRPTGAPVRGDIYRDWAERFAEDYHGRALPWKARRSAPPDDIAERYAADASSRITRARAATRELTASRAPSPRSSQRPFSATGDIVSSMVEYSTGDLSSRSEEVVQPASSRTVTSLLPPSRRAFSMAARPLRGHLQIERADREHGDLTRPWISAGLNVSRYERGDAASGCRAHGLLCHLGLVDGLAR